MLATGMERERKPATLVWIRSRELLMNSATEHAEPGYWREDYAK